MLGIFDLHPLLLLLLVVGVELCLFSIGRAIYWVLRRTWSGEASGVAVAPFIVAVTAPWALVLTFLAADIWATHKAAASHALAERGAIMRLETMAGPALAARPDLAAAAGTYREAVKRVEWTARRNLGPAAEVDAAVGAVWQAIAAAARAGVPEVLTAEMMRSADLMQTARSNRLSIGLHHVSPFKWLLLIALGLLCHVVIGAVHRDRPQAARLASAIYGAAVIVSLWGLAMHASPYAGPAAIEPSRLDRAMS